MILLFVVIVVTTILCRQATELATHKSAKEHYGALPELHLLEHAELLLAYFTVIPLDIFSLVFDSPEQWQLDLLVLLLPLLGGLAETARS